MRRLPVRPTVALIFCVCIWTAVAVPSHGQQTPPSPQAFPVSAWRAIAHGKSGEAEALARARPADDPAAVAVLAHLAIEKGRYNDAIAMLEPAARRAPLSDAGLELALLYQRLGRQGDASQLLNMLYQRAADDAGSLRRAARAAQALADQDTAGRTRNLIQDANG